MAPDTADEPLMVDGVAVTAAAELPEYDLTDYKPTREPVTLFRGYRRIGLERTQEPPPAVSQEALCWAETLRIHLSTERRPGPRARPLLEARCAERHPLLRVLTSPWGLVPLTRTSDEFVGEEPDPAVTGTPLNASMAVRRRPVTRKTRRFVHRFHAEELEPGLPRTLKDWPDERPLPPASCPCHAEVVFWPADVRKWLASASRVVVYRPSAPIV